MITFFSEAQRFLDENFNLFKQNLFSSKSRGALVGISKAMADTKITAESVLFMKIFV